MATGHLEKRSEHGYTIVIDYGRQKDAEGKTRQIRKQHSLKNCTKAQALTKLHLILADINRGQEEPSPEPLKSYLLRWYEESCVPRLQPKTLDSYKDCLDKRLIPYLGDYPLSVLNPELIQSTYFSMLKDGFGRRTVGMTHDVLRIALRRAVNLRLLLRNPTDGVQPPKPEKREMTVLRPDQIETLVSEASKSKILNLVILALHTGLRRGELLALRWSEVHLEGDPYIKVDWTLQRVKEEIIVKKPKTKKSRRDIPIDEMASSMLRKMKEDNPYEIVFYRNEGQYLDPSTVTHQFARLAKKAGFPGMRFHDQRHTYATTALLAGVDLRIVQDLLGHEDFSTTANTYVHVVDDMKRRAATAIGNILNNGKQQISSNSNEGGKDER